MSKVIVMNGVIMEEEDLVAPRVLHLTKEIEAQENETHRLNEAIRKHRDAALTNEYHIPRLYDQTLWSAYEMGRFLSPAQQPDRADCTGYDGPTETRVLNYWLKDRKEKGRCPCLGITNASDEDHSSSTFIEFDMDSDGKDTAHCIVCKRILSVD
jgi:hypothetical protein